MKSFLLIFIFTIKCYAQIEQGSLNDPRGKEFKVSIIEESMVSAVFEVMQNDPFISWTNLGGICAARGARVCRELDKKLGIKCAKAYMDCCNGGESCNFAQERSNCMIYKTQRETYQWKFHIAPVFLVRNSVGNLETKVFDLALSKVPMSVNEWRNKLNPRGNFKTYFGNRYSSYGYDQATMYKEDYPIMIEDGEKDLLELKHEE